MKRSLDRAISQYIESFAWDCTVGSGNDDPNPDFAALEEYMGHPADDAEREAFAEAWRRNVQCMAQP